MCRCAVRPMSVLYLCRCAVLYLCTVYLFRLAAHPQRQGVLCSVHSVGALCSICPNFWSLHMYREGCAAHVLYCAAHVLYCVANVLYCASYVLCCAVLHMYNVGLYCTCRTLVRLNEQLINKVQGSQGAQCCTVKSSEGGGGA